MKKIIKHYPMIDRLIVRRGYSIIWHLLLSVKWHHMFSYEVKTGPIYGMETNIKSGNGWF
jgi:hypothetical protein